MAYDYEAMFGELMAAIDKGYVLATRLKNGEIKENRPGFASNNNYLNGVLGAYAAMENHIDRIYTREESKIAT